MRTTSQPRKVAIFIFDEVEVLDFCGPFEVFSVAGRRNALNPFDVFTVAQERRPIAARNNLSVNPHYGFDDCPSPDLLVIPGGFGTRALMDNQAVLAWIKSRARKAELLLSVCTGSLLLAKAGLLDGLSATTHRSQLATLKEVAPHTTVEPHKRFVVNEKVITSAGISAGIDMSLHVIARLIGRDLALESAQYMEYDWREDSP
jgi:transcriptional regulator GlxA family with amidase domain